MITSKSDNSTNFGTNQPSYLKPFYSNNFEFGLCETSVDNTSWKQITLLFPSESAWWNKLNLDL